MNRTILTLELLAAALLAAALLSSSAWAVGRKSNSPFDYRLKSVVYNPLNTVEVNAVVGIATHITVAPGENYVQHAFGDPEAWVFSHTANNFFIKPKAANGDTNLVIVTDKRVYHILLHYVGDYTATSVQGRAETKFIRTPWSMKQATIELSYKYPLEDKKAANKRSRAERIKAALAAAEFAPGAKNFEYRMSDDPASRSIAPLNVWDDYRFTYFKFAPNAELPTIFVIGADGQESTVNVDPLGPNHNILAAQLVARQWRVRYGKDKVVGVVNGGFNPELGANPNGTIAPDVRRVEKTDDGVSAP